MITLNKYNFKYIFYDTFKSKVLFTATDPSLADPQHEKMTDSVN